MNAATKKAAASQQQRDVSVDYPAPTLSSIKLLDGSPNWLPVPDAESDAAKKEIVATNASSKEHGRSEGLPEEKQEEREAIDHMMEQWMPIGRKGNGKEHLSDCAR